MSSYISIVLKPFSELRKMGKGTGSGEGWGQGEGNVVRGHHGHKKTKNKWNNGLCSSCGNCSVCKFVNKSGCYLKSILSMSMIKENDISF